MSFDYMDAVMKRAGGHHTLRHVLLALASFADKKGICWPSLQTLHKRTGICRRTICYRLQELESLQVISRLPGSKGRSTLYQIHLATLENTYGSASDALPSAKHAHPVASDAPRSEANAPPLMHGMHTNQSVEAVRNKTGELSGSCAPTDPAEPSPPLSANQSKVLAEIIRYGRSVGGALGEIKAATFFEEEGRPALLSDGWKQKFSRRHLR